MSSRSMIFSSLIEAGGGTMIGSRGASIKRVVVASMVSTVSPVKLSCFGLVADLLSRSRYSLDRVKISSMLWGPRAFSMIIVLSSCCH
jgi:hypothetical protein